MKNNQPQATWNHTLSLLLTFIALLTVNDKLRGQSYHALLIADTADRNIGKACSNDLLKVEVCIKDQIPSTTIYTIDSKQTPITTASINEKIRRLSQKAKPGDVIFVYFSGHGLKYKNQYYLQHSDGKYHYPRNKLRQEMEGLNPRLLVIISDACAPNGKAKRLPIGAEPYGETWNPKLFRKLMSSTTGVVDIVSAREGYALTSIEQGAGSIFTTNLFSALTDPSFNNDTWKELIEFTKRQTSQDFKDQIGSYKGQKDQEAGILELNISTNVSYDIDRTTGLGSKTSKAVRAGEVYNNDDLTPRWRTENFNARLIKSNSEWYWHFDDKRNGNKFWTADVLYDYDDANAIFITRQSGNQLMVSADRIGQGSPFRALRLEDGRRWALESGEIITHFNGSPLRTAADLRKRLKDYKGSFELTVFSEGKSHKLRGHSEEAYKPPGERLSPGIKVALDQDGDLVVTDVEFRSPADRAIHAIHGTPLDIEVGDIVQKVNSIRVYSVEDFETQAQATEAYLGLTLSKKARPDNELEFLLVLRGGN
jgi:predicted DNA-binding WGR domain protein